MKRAGNIFAIAGAMILGLCAGSVVAEASDKNMAVYEVGGYGTAYDSEMTDQPQRSVQAASINTTSVDLYAIDSWAEEYISIPGSMNKSFQLKVKNASSVTYRVSSGDSVRVSSTGRIEPVVETWYWYGGIGYSYPLKGQEPTRVEKKPVYGTSKIKVTADGKTFTVTVNVLNYATYYADKKIDEYIKANITGKNLTGEQKLEHAAKMAASYNYSAGASGYVSMIITGGGDCWASTSLIIRFCEKLGYDAWARNGNRDPGAGSGHMNAMAQLPDGDLYELEAGYDEPAPRYYSVEKRTSLFSYYTVTGGIEVYQYDGRKNTGVLTVPATIDGRTVVGIGESFVSMDDFTEVRLPDTIKYIGKSAFNTCMKLKKINIPAGVETIGDFAFTQCTALTSFTCSKSNKSYTVENGILYDKNKTTVVACPSAKAPVIAGTVKNIGEYSFYYNKNLTSIVIPSSVTSLGEGAFGDCSALTKVTVNGSALQNLGNFCFSSTGIGSIVLPGSVKSVGTNAFAYCSKLKKIYFKGNYPVMGDLSLKDSYPSQYQNVFQSIEADVYYNPAARGWSTVNRKQYGGTVKWKSWPGKFLSLADCSIKISKTKWQYTGKNICPAVTVTCNGKTLKKGTDYTVTYKSNKNIGTGSITISGSGFYTGKGTRKFSITVKSGKTYTVKGYKYKVTSAKTNGSGTVSVVGNTNKKRTSITVADTVKIGGVSFRITSVGAKAFKGFGKLKTVKIGKNVKTIGTAAFYKCSNLKTVSITSTKLTSVGKKAFYGCKRLSKVTVKSSRLKRSSIGAEALKGIKSNCTFKVPKAKKSTYKKAFTARGAGKKIRVTS